MPDAHPPETDDNGGDEATPAGLAALVHENFGLLLQSLVQQIELIDDPESELLVGLWKARFIAERGFRLSERLSASVQGAGGAVDP